MQSHNVDTRQLDEAEQSVVDANVFNSTKQTKVTQWVTPMQKSASDPARMLSPQPSTSAASDKEQPPASPEPSPPASPLAVPLPMTPSIPPEGAQVILTLSHEQETELAEKAAQAVREGRENIELQIIMDNDAPEPRFAVDAQEVMDKTQQEQELPDIPPLEKKPKKTLGIKRKPRVLKKLEDVMQVSRIRNISKLEHFFPTTEVNFCRNISKHQIHFRNWTRQRQ